MHMPRKCFIVVIALIAALAVPKAAVCDTDWWGRKLPNIPIQFIFGYGSLINTPSRNATSGAAIPAIPVRVSAAFGYIRTWNDRSPSGFTALGLRKPGPGENATTINGVLYPVEGDDMTRFDAREAGYTRVEVPHEDIQAVSWQSIPEQGHIWVYVPVRQGGAPGVGLPEPDAEFPLLESYIDIVVEGGLEYGPEFARELIETTMGWSQYWLNDRELARRPWVHDAKSAVVDRMLASIGPAAPRFKDRLFAEQYAVRWSGKSP
jgi:hypothetical protein